jgi:hypothetical protein
MFVPRFGETNPSPFPEDQGRTCRPAGAPDEPIGQKGGKKKWHVSRHAEFYSGMKATARYFPFPEGRSPGSRLGGA